MKKNGALDYTSLPKRLRFPVFGKPADHVVSIEG